MRYLLALALLFAAANASAQSCPSGRCPLQLKQSQPVRNVLKAPVIVAGKVAKAAVVVPAKIVKGVAKGTAHVFREVRPVRRVLRFSGRVLTLRGPLASRIRGHRCH